MNRYLVVIEKADGNYSAYSPDVSGCVATGSTVEDAKRSFREALEMHLEGLALHGLPIPNGTAEAEYVTIG